MNPNEKQYYIYIRSTKERIPVTKQEFDDYYRDINAYRKSQMNHKLCVCPQSQWLACDMDCHTCPYRRGQEQLSLDKTKYIDYDGPRFWIEDIPDDSISMEKVYAEITELRQLLARVEELMPEAILIGMLRLDGLSERKIAIKTGIPRKTYKERIEKLRKILEAEYEFFSEKF